MQNTCLNNCVMWLAHKDSDKGDSNWPWRLCPVFSGSIALQVEGSPDMRCYHWPIGSGQSKEWGDAYCIMRLSCQTNSIFHDSVQYRYKKHHVSISSSHLAFPHLMLYCFWALGSTSPSPPFVPTVVKKSILLWLNSPEK